MIRSVLVAATFSTALLSMPVLASALEEQGRGDSTPAAKSIGARPCLGSPDAWLPGTLQTDIRFGPAAPPNKQQRGETTDDPADCAVA